MITKKQLSAFVKNKLQSNDSWAKRALLVIYDRQTPTEQTLEQTTDHNEIGFTGVDAEILTSFAKQLQTKNWLYWHQIIEVSDKAKLMQQCSRESIQMDLFEKGKVTV